MAENEKKGRGRHILLKLIVLIVLAMVVVYLAVLFFDVEFLKKVDMIGKGIEFLKNR